MGQERTPQTLHIQLNYYLRILQTITNGTNSVRSDNRLNVKKIALGYILINNNSYVHTHIYKHKVKEFLFAAAVSVVVFDYIKVKF